MADTIVSTLNLAPPTPFFGDLCGQILNVVNGDIGNANTSYTYFGLIKDGFNEFSLQFVITATTLTFEGSNDLPQVSNASAVWTDITSYLTGAMATDFVATGSYSTDAAIPWSRLRIKRVTTNATNALKLILTRMRSE